MAKKKIQDLSAGGAAGTAKAEVKAPEVKTVAKTEKPKLSEEELKAQRLKNLKVKQKSPERAKLEEDMKGGIKTLLTGKPEGLFASDLIETMFEGLTDVETKDYQKLCRKLCRDMGCTRISVENSRKVKYILPA